MQTFMLKPLAKLLSTKLALETLSVLCSVVTYWLFQYPEETFWVPRSPSNANESLSLDELVHVWDPAVLTSCHTFDIRPDRIAEESHESFARNPIELPAKLSWHRSTWELFICIVFWLIPPMLKYAVISKTVTAGFVGRICVDVLQWFANGVFYVYPVLLANGIAFIPGVLMSGQMCIPVGILGFLLDRLPHYLENWFVDRKSLAKWFNEDSKWHQMVSILIRLLFLLSFMLPLGIPLARQIGYAILLGTRSNCSWVAMVSFQLLILSGLMYLVYLYGAAMYWLYYQSPIFKIAWHMPNDIKFNVSTLSV